LPIYITLGKFTQEEITKIKKSPERLEAARKVLKSVGGDIKEFYYTLGQYDFVVISEAPSDEAMMKALFIICSRGTVRTETPIAIRAEKGAEIIEELP